MKLAALVLFAAAVAPPPLPLLPSIARVRVTTHGATLAIVEDVNLPRGDWAKNGVAQTLKFHVAFGAPGPRAIDARLVPVADGALEPDDADVGEPLPSERVPRRPADVYPLLGKDNMAGVVFTIKPDLMTKALARGNMAALRVRMLVDATDPDETGATSVVVRLGASRGTPLTLGRIVASTATPGAAITKADARLCGPDADPHPLAVGGAPRISGAIAPVLSVRHATDDLCLKLWR